MKVIGCKNRDEMLPLPLLWSLTGLIPMLAMVNGYQKYYTFEMEHCDKQSAPFEVHLNKSGLGSAVIFRASPRGGFPHGKSCYMKIDAPKDTGIIFHTKFVHLKLKHETECSNSIKLNYTDNGKAVNVAFCDDKTRYYCSDPGSPFGFTFTPSHEGSNATSRMNFDVTFTAFLKGACGENYFSCTSNKCLWKPYECDVRDNCDQKEDNFCDEFAYSKHVEKIVMLTTEVVIGAGLVICFALLIKYCITRNKFRNQVSVPHTKSDILVKTPIVTPNPSQVKFHQHGTSFS